MDWLAALPPIVAIVVVLWKKEVILALLLAVLSAELLILMQSSLQSTGHALIYAPIASLERIVTVGSDAGNLRILMFSVLVGALLALIRESGGVAATVHRLISSGVANSKRRVGGLTMATGIAVFVESNLSVLTAGILARGLFDKFAMSRARLAYVIDSTSAPICILILLNGWGAYILALLNNYTLPESSVNILWGTIPFNFYALITLAILTYTIVTDKVHGPMCAYERQAQHSTDIAPSNQGSKARLMLIPLTVMVVAMLGFMWWTGNGDIASGSGSKSVLYATTLATITAYLLMLLYKRADHHQAVHIMFKGMGEMLPLVSIVLLSLTLGASLKILGTGLFIANLVGDFLPVFMIVPMLFIAGAIISFTTGTSWGTFAILIPIAVPFIQMHGLPPSLVIAAVLGGGIFGDHCSPISDTTAVSSIASGCDLLTHVKTQLPYALTAGVLALVAYTVASIIATR